jgi:hypothetical protein
MRAHAVHSKADQCNFLSVPVERGVDMALGLPPTILSARHFEEVMLCGQAHEPDALTELMTDTPHLVLVHVV